MTGLPELLARTDRKRLDAYKQNLAFYNGRQWTRPNQRAKQLVYNYARAAIAKVAAHVAPAHTIQIFAADESDQPRAERAEQALKAIYQINSIARLDFDTEVDTSVLGDGCYKITTEPEEGVCITAPDIQGIYAWTSPHRLTEFVRVAQRYTLQASNLPPGWPALPAKQQSAQVTEDWTAETLDIWQDSKLIASGANPYRDAEDRGILPFVIYPNDSVPKQWWGVSDIEAFRTPATELNSAFTRLTNILELSGNPITVLAGVDSSQGIAATPGAVWELPDQAKASLLDLLSGGGVKLHIDHIELLYRAIHDLSEIPRAAFAGISRDLSGVALEIELRPLTQKVARKKLIRDPAFEQRARIALQLHDQLHPDDRLYNPTDVIQITAAEPVVPRDASTEIAQEALAVQAGIRAPTTAMTRLGDDDSAAEFAKVLDETAQLTAVRPALTNPAKRA